MPRNHDQCRVRRRAKSSRSPKWAACTIATNAWRPEVAILRAHGSSIAGPTGGVERVDSRRLANIRSAPSPEGPPLLDRTTPARKTRLPARPHPITFLPTPGSELPILRVEGPAFFAGPALTFWIP